MKLLILNGGSYINIEQVALFEYADNKFHLHFSPRVETDGSYSQADITLSEEDSKELKALLMEIQSRQQ
jgi:hypothetical protein